jgi:hypothetical protein
VTGSDRVPVAVGARLPSESGKTRRLCRVAKSGQTSQVAFGRICEFSGVAETLLSRRVHPA